MAQRFRGIGPILKSFAGCCAAPTCLTKRTEIVDIFVINLHVTRRQPAPPLVYDKTIKK
jgi:hypothetical protein